MKLLLENGTRVDLVERLTFDRLFRLSDPKRVYRSGTVSGPPMEIDAYRDSVYYTFNFKSNPSTTGLRHRGYIKFFKPRTGQQPLQHVPCLVDCTCPDYRYRWAWANKQRGSSRVGTGSLNQSLNRAPRITNPRSRPGLCKHILATREYLYGLLTTFAGDEPDTAEKLNKLVKYAQKRWAEYPEQMRAAKERERRLKAAQAARRAGAPLPTAMVPEEPAVLVGPGTAAGAVSPEDALPAELPEPVGAPPVKAVPLAVPPGQRRRQFPGAAPNNLAIPPQQRGRRFPGGEENPKVESVGIMKDQPINAMTDRNQPNNVISLTDARSIVEEMIDDVETETEEQALVPVDDTMAAPSDDAVGADTEGAAVIGLLSDIRDLLAQLASPEAAEMGDGEEEVALDVGMEAEGEPGDDEYNADFPPPPDGEDLDGEDDEEEEERVPAAA